MPHNNLPARGPSPTKNPTRLFWLDVLRGVAVMLVLFRHMTPLPDTAPHWLSELLFPLTNAGWMGVDLFFVLSGFLVRRGFKIHPAFYLLLSVTIIAVENFSNRIPWPPVLTEAFFIWNYLPGDLETQIGAPSSASKAEMVLQLSEFSESRRTDRTSRWLSNTTLLACPPKNRTLAELATPPSDILIGRSGKCFASGSGFSSHAQLLTTFR